MNRAWSLGGHTLCPTVATEPGVTEAVETTRYPYRPDATLNGATYLGRHDRIGSIAVGKDADLVVLDGNPLTDMAAITRMELVFKKGLGYDSAALFASVKGLVGWK